MVTANDTPELKELAGTDNGYQVSFIKVFVCVCLRVLGDFQYI